MGTRIIAKNTQNPNNKYVIQRYVINPEGRKVKINQAILHREKPEYSNMTWYQGNEEIKIFKLDKAVTGKVEDIRLENYKLDDLTNTINKEKAVVSGQNRLRLDFKDIEYDKPIIVDVKVPYNSENAGVGTGMDLYTNEGIFWKSDFYESASYIVEGDDVVVGGEAGNIKGGYISDDFLDVTNTKKKYDFSFKKVNDKKNSLGNFDAVSGATFKLQGPKIDDKNLGKEFWQRSGTDGMVNFKNLEPGIYRLTETGAAQGYENSNTNWTVTVLKDGKVYIRDNNPGATVPDNSAKWQKVDTSETNPNRHDQASSNNGDPVRIATKITEVNKKENKFRQVYIINGQPENLSSPYFEIHAQKETRDLNLENTTIVSMNLVDRSSTPEKLVSVGEKVDYTTKVYVKNNGQNRIQINPKNLAGENKTIALTIESEIPNSGTIGTGLDFINSGFGNHYWLSQWYDSFNDMKLQEAPNTTTDKNATVYVGGERAAGSQSIMQPKDSPKPVIYSKDFGLMARSFNFNENPSLTESFSSPMKFRSANINTFANGLEIGDELAGSPVGAGGWEKVDPNKSEGRAKINHENSLVATRIIEIDKDANRFKQVFLFTDGSPGSERLVQLHRQPENGELAIKSGRNIDTIVKAYKVNASNIDDALNGPKTNFNVTTEQTTPSGKPRRVQFSIPGNQRGYILVEVETSYNGALGLGSDYKPNRSDLHGTSAWAGDSYSSEAGVNKYKSQESQITYEKSSEITEIPIEDYSNDPSKYVNDPNLPKGQYRIVDGEKGSKRTYYLVEYKDGVPTGNKKIDTSRGTNGVDIIKEMTPKLRYVGTKDEAQPQEYRVNTIPVDHGSVSAQLTAKSGSTVTVDIHPDSNYEIDKIEVLHNKTGQLLTTVDISTKTFTMPANDVALKAYFKPISTPQPSEFNINIIKKDGGTVTTDKSTAKKGDTITLNITPDKGWQIESMNVVGKNGGSVATVNQQAKTFTMPAEDVWVQVTFKQIPTKSFYVGSEPHSWGIVSVDPTESRNQYAKVGEKVTFTLNPYQGYKATGATVTKNKGGLVDVTFDEVTGKGYFIMPDISPSDAVTVRGVFKSTNGERTVTREKQEVLKYSTSTTIDASLSPGERVVDQKGQNGSVRYIYQITFKRQDGTTRTVSRLEKILFTVSYAAEGDATPPADWPQDVLGELQSERRDGEVIIDYKRSEVPGSRIEPTPEKVRIGKSDDPIDHFTPEDGKDVLVVDPENNINKKVEITNKKDGITPKILKRDAHGNPLKGAKFTIKKMTDDTYKKKDDSFIPLSGTSGNDGNIIFKNQAGNEVKLQPGYYVITEDEAPVGYKKITAEWKMEVKDDGGRMYAVYQGPEETPSSLLDDDKKANAGKSFDNEQIKYYSRLTFINPESKTYVQRIYIDTRGYTGNQLLNVQITPKYKREEIDTAGQPPVTIKEGVKTAYRSTYQILNPDENKDIKEKKYDKILRTYDLSHSDMSMVNTARWRPFDWGFEEDQLNLGKGVYIIDVEGYYDDSIIDGRVTNEVKIDNETNYNLVDENGNKIPDKDLFKTKNPVKKDPYDRTDIKPEDLGKLDLHVDFYEGKRTFDQFTYKDGQDGWDNGYEASYQAGMQAVIAKLKKKYGAAEIDEWLKTKEGKYAIALSKQVTYKGKTYYAGKVNPPTPGEPFFHADTSANLNPIYKSKNGQEVPKEGLTVVNDEETYNITFSKHGRDNPNWGDNSSEVTRNRLEGAVFRLQEQGPGGIFEDMPGTTVASAFNGYFGFRGLKPGRYRLMEVKAPKGYRPINDPILYMTIAYKKGDIDQATGEITPGRGVVTLEYNKNAKGIIQYAPDKKGPDGKPITPEDGKLVDYVTSATAKNMGKIINEKPGKGKVTITKKDGEGSLLNGAEFSLYRLSTKDEKGNVQSRVLVESGTIGEENSKLVDKDGKPIDTNGKLLFTELPIGNYELVETKPAPGYQNKGQKWYFTVGGKGLDPYANDDTTPRRDISSTINLSSSEINVLRPDFKEGDKVNDGEIKPHSGEALSFKNKFKLKDETVIKPGDYFVLKLTNNIDLEGIFREKTRGLDLFADGVGTIAKAIYDKEAGTITYVFTGYAEQYDLKEFENDLTAHINLMKVPKSSNQTVGLGIKDQNAKTKNIYVKYDLNMAKLEDGPFLGSDPNMTSKIVSFNRETGEFVQYFYINREKTTSKPLEFRYKPSENVKDLKMDLMSLAQNGKKYMYNYYTGQYNIVGDFIDIDMPESFGVNENSDNIYRYASYGSMDINKGVGAKIPIGALNPNQSVILKVTGRVDVKDIASYETYAKLFGRWGDYEAPYVERTNGVRIFENKSEASADLNINAINPKNEITFKKVDQEGTILPGAKFKLVKYDKSEGKWKDVHDSSRETTTENKGLIKYEKLEPGKYALVETDAPQGYTKIEGHVQEFTVGDDGVITREVIKSSSQVSEIPGTPRDKGENAEGNTISKLFKKLANTVNGNNVEKVEEPVGIEPIEVINYKDVEFVKIDGNDKSKKLKGAVFEVYYKESEDGDYQALKKIVDGKETEETMTVVSGEDGKFKLPISKPGYYALEEKTAPKGYTRIPGKIREFKVENGKVQVLEKDPLKASLKTSTKGKISSQILSVDKEKGTFRQRIVINPNHEEMTIPSNQSFIRIKENDWKITPKYKDSTGNGTGKGGEVKVALLTKEGGKTPTDLIETDFKKMDALSFTTVDNITGSRYGLKEMLGKENVNNTSITTTDSIVMEFTGKLDDNNKSSIADQLFELVLNVGIDDQVSDKLNVDYLASGKPAYAEYNSKEPIQVENKKINLPLTNGLRAWIGFTIIGLILMLLAAYYYNKKKNKGLDLEKNS